MAITAPTNDLEHARRHVRRNFVVLAFLCMAEPLSSTILLPFVYFMVKDFGYEETEIGAKAGLLTSAFFLVQMVSTPVWCIISDRIGRKPCLVFGLVGTAFAMILFGTSQSLPWAIASCALCGLLNGNLAVSRTMVGELAEATGVAKGRTFSIFGFCIGVGWMVGPFIGGSLASPAEQMGFSGPHGLFETYPFLLPCLFSTVYNLSVGTLTLLFLTKTGKLAEQAAHGDDGNDNDETGENESSRLLAPGRYNSGTSAEHDISPCFHQGVKEQPLNLRRAQGFLLLSSFFYFVHIICFDELYALFAASSSSQGIGLSFQPRQIASSLAYAGPAMIGALLWFPALHQRFTSMPLYRLAAVVSLVLLPLFSLLPKVAAEHGPSDGTPIVLWAPLIVLILFRYAAMVVGLASLQIMSNDMVKPEERALINGLGQSVGSFARAVGPSLGGFTWSWSLGNNLIAPFDFHASVPFFPVPSAGVLSRPLFY